ncbi:MAG: AgmX/PglI C-terminal domain-containing protein [Pseudomonadota bacterium]
MDKAAVPNLKIGVLESGRLINEIVIDDTSDVTIGTSLESTITVVEENFPGILPFLKYGDDGRYYLVFMRGVTGKIFDGDDIILLDGINPRPECVNKFGHQALPLSGNMRGMLNLKQNTILFKIYPSEVIPKKLPSEFKGGFFGGDFDLSFGIILTTLLISYAVLAYSFSRVEYVEKIEFEKIPEKFARLIMDMPAIPKEEKKQKVASIEDKKKEEEKNKNEKKPDKKKVVGALGTKKPGSGVTTGKNPSELVRTAGIIGIIGSKGSGGTVANLFQQSGFEQKLDKALKGVSGLYVAKNMEEAKMKKGTTEGKGIDVGSLKTTTGTGVVAFGTSNATAANIIGKASDSDIVGEGKMSPNVIARILSQHVSAFQYCYNKALQGNPRLGGELKVKFLIKENGAVDSRNIQFSGVVAKDGNLTSCVQRVFSRIKFPSPKGGDVVVNYPLNFMAQN